MSIERPMLAASLSSVNQVIFPCFAQYKIDGIRCYMTNNIGYSRTAKPLPNRWIQQHLHDSMLPDGLDGEIITLKEDGITYDSYNDVQSKVMTQRGQPQFHYIVFDLNSAWSYRVRYLARMSYLELNSIRLWIKPVRELYITWLESLESFEQDAIAEGHEGIIIRSPIGMYKHGRSTINEQYLLKLKRMEDDEAIVMGYEELKHNCCSAEQDSFGLTERSSFKDEQIGGNKLGALICKSSRFTEFFKIGSGFTDYQRKDIWDNKLKYLGKTLTYKYQKHGMKDKPRIPIFKGWRLD